MLPVFIDFFVFIVNNRLISSVFGGPSALDSYLPLLSMIFGFLCQKSLCFTNIS